MRISLLLLFLRRWRRKEGMAHEKPTKKKSYTVHTCIWVWSKKEGVCFILQCENFITLETLQRTENSQLRKGAWGASSPGSAILWENIRHVMSGLVEEPAQMSENCKKTGYGLILSSSQKMRKKWWVGLRDNEFLNTGGMQVKAEWTQVIHFLKEMHEYPRCLQTL